MSSIGLLRSCLCLALASMCLGGCGDDDGGAGGGDAGTDGAPLNCAANGGADCFELPTAPMTKAATTTAADFSCAPEAIQTRTESMMVAGQIRDFQNEDPLPMATIKAFYGSNISGAFDAMATADASGNYTITLPSGARSRRSRRSWRPPRHSRRCTARWSSTRHAPT